MDWRSSRLEADELRLRAWEPHDQALLGTSLRVRAGYRPDGVVDSYARFDVILLADPQLRWRE